MEENNNSNIFKIIILGDKCTGKSSIITRYIFDTYTSTGDNTLGIDFYQKTLEVRDKKIKL